MSCLIQLGDKISFPLIDNSQEDVNVRSDIDSINFLSELVNNDQLIIVDSHESYSLSRFNEISTYTIRK